MGGLSSRELMEGPTVPREGDFVENCLENLSKRSKLLRCSCYDAGINGYVDDSNEDEDPEGMKPITPSYPPQLQLPNPRSQITTP